MDPNNRIGGTVPATSTSPAPAAPELTSAVAAPSLSSFNPISFMLPMVMGRFSEWREERMKSLRPMSTFLNRERISFPTPSDIPSRVRANVTYFQTNYIVLFVVLGLYCLLTSPSLILWIGLLAAAWIYILKVRNGPFVIMGREIPEQVTMGILALISLLFIWFGSIGNTVFWLLGATVVLVGLHSLAYTPVEVDEFGFGTDLPTTMPNTPAAKTDAL